MICYVAELVLWCFIVLLCDLFNVGAQQVDDWGRISEPKQPSPERLLSYLRSIIVRLPPCLTRSLCYLFVCVLVFICVFVCLFVYIWLVYIFVSTLCDSTSSDSCKEKTSSSSSMCSLMFYSLVFFGNKNLFFVVSVTFFQFLFLFCLYMDFQNLHTRMSMWVGWYLVDFSIDFSCIRWGGHSFLCIKAARWEK